MTPDLARISPWTASATIGGLALLTFVACFGTDAGIVWDEPFQSEYGERVLNWYRSGFTDHGAMEFENLYLYGGLFEALAQWIASWSPFDDPYDTRHLVTGLAGFAGVVFTALTAGQVGGPRAACLAGLMLAATPAWVGHSWFNSKDVPFGAAAIAVAFVAVRLATGPVPSRWRDVTACGVTLGIALAVRPAGYFLAVFPAVGVTAAGLVKWREPVGTEASVSALRHWTNPLRLLLAVPIAWTLMLVAWPWAQLAPISRPIYAMKLASNFPWDGETLFNGAMVPANALPWTYLPVWFGTTAPETLLIAMLLGVCAVTVGRRGLNPRRVAGTVTIAVAAALPIAAALYTRPDLYDGLRHFLFVFPLLAALAGIAVSAFLSSRCPSLVKLSGALACAVAVAMAAIDLVRLHPYQYVYFNRLFGGLPAAAGRFETDYWGASYKEGLAWVIDQVPPVQPGVPTRVSSCNPNSNDRLNHYRTHWAGADQRIAIVPEYRVSEVFLAVTRYGCHQRPGEVIHTVARQGVPLLYVIRAVPNY